MKKLWKVKVRDWGWAESRTIYAESRKEAENIAWIFPAADRPEYAGNFTDKNAQKKLNLPII